MVDVTTLDGGGAEVDIWCLTGELGSGFGGDISLAILSWEQPVLTIV